MHGGSLLQLRNAINRRNVAGKVKGRFNSTIDFMESVVECHITAAGMQFFGMDSLSDQPKNNSDFVLACMWTSSWSGRQLELSPAGSKDNGR